MFKTADLCDAAGQSVQVLAPLLQGYGGASAFHGPIATVKVDEDITSVRALLAQAGHGRVLVVDGGGSLRCALVGDNLAQLAIDNGWAGLVIYGCVRDTAELAQMPIGVKALATNPRRSEKRAPGAIDQPVSFGGIEFVPGHHLYADADGVIVASRPLVP